VAGTAPWSAESRLARRHDARRRQSAPARNAPLLDTPRALEVFSQQLAQHHVIERLISYQPLQPTVLFLVLISPEKWLSRSSCDRAALAPSVTKESTIRFSLQKLVFIRDSLLALCDLMAP
jgi:hypothetical protein